MNDKEKNIKHKESKFRFLNPEEKKKLKELNDSIIGKNKNISFDSNVDLSKQFESKGYDTQKYNIKKIVNSRLEQTQIFDNSAIREALKETEEDVKEYLIKAKDVDKFESTESKDNGIIILDINDEIEKSENDTNLEPEIIKLELERIMLNSNDDTFEKSEVKPKRLYSKHEQAKKFFEYDGQVEDDKKEKIDFTKLKQYFVKNKMYIILGSIILLIVFFIFNILNALTNTNQHVQEQNNDIVENVNVETVIDKPLEEKKKSEYTASLEITNSNTNSIVLEITNSNFKYVKQNNNTDYFVDFVYANVRNARPYKEFDRFIAMFGKDSIEHFASLKYLYDEDFFNTIEVRYNYNNETTIYKALAYYSTEKLDDRFYKDMSGIELSEFLGEEVKKSKYILKDYIAVESKIMTLITFDMEQGIYHVLYLIDKKF